MPDTPLTFLRDKDVPGVALMVIAVNQYTAECFDWEPEILRKELEDDFNIELSDVQSDKLQAAITILTTDQFESNWHVFNTCIHILNGEHADFEVLDPIEAEQIAAIIPEIEILRNGDEDGIKFSDEVNVFAGLIFCAYGCSKAPDIFPTAMITSPVDSSMIEKNEALNEMYDAKKKYLQDYVKRVCDAYII